MSDLKITPNKPYLGLSSFTEETADYFFGRKREIEEIHNRLEENTLTILYGQSGLGKSSLLGAGLIPRLRSENYEPILLRLGYEKEAPNLLEQTRSALEEITGLSFSKNENLWQTVHRLHSSDDDEKTPILIFDQFEEIFTLGDNRPDQEEQVRQWLTEMADLIQNRPPQALEKAMRKNRRLAREYDFSPADLRVIITLREDYLSHLEEWKSSLPLLMQNRMALYLLRGPQALQAVMGPASIADPPLVNETVAAQIVRTAARVPADTALEDIGAVPPILSLLCEQLNLARLEQKDTQIKAEIVAEKSEDILQHFYEESFTSFPEKERSAIRSLVEDKMVTVGGHRNPVAWDDAEHLLRQGGIQNPTEIFTSLIQRRLITKEERGISRLEITHDVLIPIILNSRKERQKRLAEEEKLMALEQARLEARKRNRLKALLILSCILLLAAILAIYFALEGQKKLREAAEELEKKEMAQLALLSQASYADHEAGIRAEKAENIREAYAYYARGLRYMPENGLIAQKAISSLLLNATYKKKWSMAFKEAVYEIAYSPDGSSIAAGSWDGSLRVFDTHSGTELWNSSFEGTLAYSPDGSSIAAGSEDGSLRVFDTRSGTELWNTSFKETVQRLAYSPDGSSIAAGSRNGSLRVFDTRSGTELWNSSFKGTVYEIAYSPDGSSIAAGSRDGSLRVFDTRSGTELWNTSFEGTVQRLAYSPDGSSIAAGSEDGSLRVFDTRSGTELWNSSFEGTVQRLAYSSNGSSIAAGSRDGSLRVFDTRSGTELWNSSFEGTLAYSPDGSSIAVGAWDGSLRVFDTHLGKELWNSSFKGTVYEIAYSPDGSSIAASSEDGSLRVFDTRSGTELWNTTFKKTVCEIAYSPDGSSIAAGSRDGSLRVFDTRLGTEFWNSTFKEAVYEIAYSPGGSSIAAASWDGSLRVFDTRSGTELWNSSFKGTLAYSPDGSSIAAGSEDGSLRVFDTRSGTELWNPSFKGTVQRLAYSPDGSSIAAGSRNGSLRVFDTHSGTELWNSSFKGTVHRLAYSSNGSSIAAGSRDGSLWVFDTRSGTEPWNTTFKEAVYKIAYSPDGSSIAASSEDGSLRVFDTHLGKELWNSSFKETVCEIAYSPDGSSIAAASWDGSLWVFDTRSETEPWNSSFKGTVCEIAYSPDGSSIAAGSWDGSLRVFDTHSGTELWNTSFKETVQRLAYSPDGSSIAAGSEDGSLRVFDTHLGTELWNTTFKGSVCEIAYSPDGSSIAAGSRDGSLRVLDLGILKYIADSEHITLTHYLDYSAQQKFNRSGLLSPLPFDHLTQLQQNSLQEAKSDKQGPFYSYLRWHYSEPHKRTLSPFSKTLLRNHISERLRSEKIDAAIVSYHARAPWHPLCPVSLACLERNKDNDLRKKFLCKLTLKRLEKADAKLWGKEHLSKDAEYAAQWMKELGYPDLAKKTEQFRQNILSQ